MDELATSWKKQTKHHICFNNRMTQKEWATHILWKLFVILCHCTFDLWLPTEYCLWLQLFFSTGEEVICYCKCSFIDYQYPNNFSFVSPRCLFWTIDPFTQWHIGHFHRNIDLRNSHTNLRCLFPSPSPFFPSLCQIWVSSASCGLTLLQWYLYLLNEPLFTPHFIRQ